MTPLDKQKVFQICDGDIELTRIVWEIGRSNLASFEMVDYLWKNKIWGKKLWALWEETGAKVIELRRYLLIKLRIGYTVKDLIS